MKLSQIYKQAKVLVKEQIQLREDIDRINKDNLNYEALQRIVNVASKSITPVDIDIVMKDGTKLFIRPSKTEGNAISFRDKFQEFNKRG